MKVRMQEMQRTVMAKYNSAVKMEEETNRLKENYKVAIGKQNQMRRTIYEHEDKQEVLDRDVKEITRRLYEKEEYLRELNLFKPGNSIEEAEKMDKKLVETKQLYKENFDTPLGKIRQELMAAKQSMKWMRKTAASMKFNKARQKKFALE